jgi:hypothetical protein
MTSEEENARLVAQGALSALMPGLREARDVLESVGHPARARVGSALLELEAALYELLQGPGSPD